MADLGELFFNDKSASDGAQFFEEPKTVKEQPLLVKNGKAILRDVVSDKEKLVPIGDARKFIESGQYMADITESAAQKHGIKTEEMRRKEIASGGKDAYQSRALKAMTGILNLTNMVTFGGSDRLLSDDAKLAKEQLSAENPISAAVGSAAGMIYGVGVLNAAGKVLAKGAGGIARVASGSKYLHGAVTAVSSTPGISRVADIVGKVRYVIPETMSASQRAMAIRAAGSAGKIAKDSLALGADFAKYGFVEGLAKAGTEGKDIVDTLSEASGEAFDSFKTGAVLGLALAGTGSIAKAIKGKITKEGKLATLHDKKALAELDLGEAMLKETSLGMQIREAAGTTKEFSKLLERGVKTERAAAKAGKRFSKLEKKIADVEKYGITGSEKFAKMRDIAGNIVTNQAVRATSVAIGAATGGVGGALIAQTMNPAGVVKMLHKVGAAGARGVGAGIGAIERMPHKGAAAALVTHIGDDLFKDITNDVKSFDVYKSRSFLEQVVPDFDSQFKQIVIDNEMKKMDFLKQKVQQMEPAQFPGLARTSVSARDKQKLSDYIHGTYHPEGAVDRFNNGTLSKEYIEAVDNAEPGITEAMRSIISEVIHTEQKQMDLDTVRSVSTLLGVPSPYSSVHSYYGSATEVPQEEVVAMKQAPKFNVEKKTRLQQLMSGQF